jgi:hypothetical protein
MGINFSEEHSAAIYPEDEGVYTSEMLVSITSPQGVATQKTTIGIFTVNTSNSKNGT